MKAFLKKLKLVDHLTTELEIQKNEFVIKFQKQVEQANIGLFSDYVDIFSSNKKAYKGQVSMYHFKIKRKQKLFDQTINTAIAQGNFEQSGSTLIIETEINGFRNGLIPYYIFLTIFYPLFISGFFFSAIEDGSILFFFVPFILLHATIMFGGPYFMMRRSIKRMKHNLEREFFYLTKP